MTRRRALLLLVLVTAGGAALRLYNLEGRSLWVDEIVTWEGMQRPTFISLQGWVAFDQMPLFYVVEWLLRGLGGSEAGIRALSVACGVLMIPALYLVTRRVAQEEAALWAALLAAISPFLVWYSQDSTSYALHLLTSTLAAWTAHRAVERARLPDWLLFSLAAAATAYTHYSGFLVVVGLYAWAGLAAWSRRDPVRLVALLTSGMVAVALVAPWTPWIHALFAYSPPLSAKASATGIPLAAQPVRLAVELGLLPVVLALAAAGGWALRRQILALALPCLWLAAPVAGVVLSARTAALALPGRYYAAAVPPLLLLAGVGAAYLASRLPTLARQRPAAWLAIVLIAASLPQLVLWYAEPKDDWRAAARVIEAGATPQSAVVILGYGTAWSGRDISYYLRRDGERLTVVNVSAPLDPAAVAILARAGSVFAVFNTGNGPPDLRFDGRSATGDFTPVPPASGSVTVYREVGVTVARAPSAHELLAWASSVEPQARAWDDAVVAASS